MHWLVLSIRILKNSPHKAITVKKFISSGEIQQDPFGAPGHRRLSIYSLLLDSSLQDLP